MHTLFNLQGDIPALIAFFSYLSAVMLIGVIAYFATRSFSDYVLGGRKLGGAVAALSAGASDMSSWLLLGLPGLVYVSGVRSIWVSVGLVVGAYLCWRLIAKPLRIYSEVAGDSVTLPAYLDNRFRDTSKAIRMVSALAILIFFVYYIASGLYAGGLLLSRAFHIDYTYALWWTAGIIMLYTSVGGFLAVSWTDFIQGNLMLLCLLLVPFFAVEQVGGWHQGIEGILAHQPHYLDFLHELNAVELISLVSWGLGYFGMPHILVRFMSVKSVKEIPLARRVCISWMSLSLIGAVLVGIVGAMHFYEPLQHRETVFMALGEQVFPAWIMGLILAAILSSSMCAIDSQMLAASSALTEDFYRALFRRHASQRELVWVGRATCVLIAGVGIYLARVPEQSIMELVTFAWGGLGSTFGAAVVLSLFWKRTTRTGVVLGMILGALTVILWYVLGYHSHMNAILPGTLMAYVGTVMGSLGTPKPAQEILLEFEKVRTLCRIA